MNKSVFTSTVMFNFLSTLTKVDGIEGRLGRCILYPT